MIEARPTPHPSSPASLDEGMSVEQIVRFADRHWIPVVGFAIAFAAVALILFGLVLPPDYSSSATLVVVQPPVSSELQPRALSVHGYKTLFESDAVVSATQRRLIEEGVLEEDEPLQIDEELLVRIFVSRSQEANSLAPMLEAEAIASSAEKAARIANVWVEVFLEQVRAIVRQATLNGVTFVEQQYPKTKEDLVSEEAAWISLADEFHARRQKAADDGDRRVAVSRKRTAELVASHRAESRSMIEEHARERMGSLRAAGGAGLQPEVFEKLAELTGLRAQMAQTSDLLLLEKAITDDALWQSVTRGAPVDPSRTLQTQEPNPVYSELELEAIRVEGQLRRLAGEWLEPVAEITRGMEKLQQERSASLAKLREDRRLELTLLQRRQRFELDAIERERDLKLGQVKRGLDQLTLLERQLARNYSEAILARAQEEVDAVYLASPAVAVATPEDRMLPLKSFLGLLVGGLFGLVLAVVREVHSRRRAA